LEILLVASPTTAKMFVSTAGVMAPVARVWNAWRAQRHGAEPTARAVGPVRARPVPLGTVRAGSVRSTARFGMFTRTSPRVASRVVTAAFFDEDPAWDAVVAAEKAADETNTQHDARDGAALAMSDDFVASKPLEYERSVAAFVCLAVAAVVLSVPFGFVRWNLSTLAPLVWWQLGLSTGVGTAMAAPLVYACTLPAIRARCNLPVLARASFGVRGAKIADLGRGILGLVLFTLITLAGGEAVLGAASALANNGVLYDGVFADPDSFAGLVERLVAYVAFWAAQCAVLVTLRPDKRLMWCARGGSALVCFHFIRAVAAGFREAALLDLPLAPLVPEFWTHAVLTAGVWFTLAALLPDYARKCVNEDGYLKAQAFWLPLLAGCVAVAALGVTGESSPVACLLSVAAACLVTNATATSVGAVSAIRAWKPQGAKRSAFIVALVGAHRGAARDDVAAGHRGVVVGRGYRFAARRARHRSRAGALLAQVRAIHRRRVFIQTRRYARVSTGTRVGSASAPWLRSSSERRPTWRL
jgi:hypothetical protein